LGVVDVGGVVVGGGQAGGEGIRPGWTHRFMHVVGCGKLKMNEHLYGGKTHTIISSTKTPLPLLLITYQYCTPHPPPPINPPHSTTLCSSPILRRVPRVCTQTPPSVVMPVQTQLGGEQGRLDDLDGAVQAKGKRLAGASGHH